MFSVIFLTPRRRPVPVPRRRKVQKPDNESAPVSRQQPITTQPISSYTTLSSKSLTNVVFLFFTFVYFACCTWHL